MAKARTPNKKLNLALQGGGAHGAYTWGVLDRLLEEEDVAIEGISGTSAGAINAAVLVNGYMQGGREGAKHSLEMLWRKISEASCFSPLHKTVYESYLTGWNLDYSPSYYFVDALSRMVSPYDMNPLNINPLKGVLETVIDVDVLQACGEIKLFVAATHVESGQARVFDCENMSIDVLLASACLPQMFQAVEIDGEHYWDGGYMGNPVIWPLIYNCESEDVMLVQINPIHRAGVPKQSLEIANRLNEITFNSSLISEMRAIDFVSRLIKEGRVEHGRYKDVKVHLVYSPEELKSLNASSKLNGDWDFFCYLRDVGRNAAELWLADNKEHIGVRSTVDVRDKFLGGTSSSRLVSKKKKK
jgi:NTE family protein